MEIVIPIYWFIPKKYIETRLWVNRIINASLSLILLLVVAMLISNAYL